MKKKTFITSFFCASMFLFACNSGCEATTVHVGGEGRLIALKNSDGSGGTNFVVTDANGNVSVPCGQVVGINQ